MILECYGIPLFNMLKFYDQSWDWKNDNLFDMVYKCKGIPIGWDEFFLDPNVISELNVISKKLCERAKKTTLFPLMEDVFRAFQYTRDPKVVLLGQNPYHNEGSAVGLCFSLPPGAKYINPSLRNIQKEVKANGFNVDECSGDISRWARDGVFLVNSALTVEKGDADSGLSEWADFTDLLIKYLSNKPRAWLLWGKPAQSYEISIKNRGQHFVFKCSHPSPLSANNPSGGNPAFLGSKCFQAVNEWLGDKAVDWTIE